MASAFQLVSILIYEGFMKGRDFEEIARLLWKRGCQRGFQILLQLVRCDSRVNLTCEERWDLASIMSRLQAEGQDDSTKY